MGGAPRPGCSDRFRKGGETGDGEEKEGSEEGREAEGCEEGQAEVARRATRPALQCWAQGKGGDTGMAKKKATKKKKKK
jgi:hypothetical protein